MFMKIVCGLLVAASLFSTAVAAGPGLVITDRGYEVLTIGADGRIVSTPVVDVIDLRTGTTPSPDGGGGTGDELTNRIAAVTKAEIATADHAMVLAMTLNTINKYITNDANVETALNSALSLVGVSIGKTQVDKWYAALKAVSGFTLTKAGLTAALAGVLKSHDLDPGIIKTVVDAAYEGFEKGESVEEVIAGLRTAYPDAAFDFTQIIQLIMAVLKLLQDLGFVMQVVVGVFILVA